MISRKQLLEKVEPTSNPHDSFRRTMIVVEEEIVVSHA